MSWDWVPVVVIPLVLTEFGSWATWLATKVVRCAARCLGEPGAAARYTEEFTATIAAVPGQLTRLAAAVGILAATPVLRHVLRTAPEVLAPEPGNPPAETGRGADGRVGAPSTLRLDSATHVWTTGATDDRHRS
jgi:hypothetical protein